MSTENVGEAMKAKPFLRKTKFILEKNRKIKILGGFVKNGMAWMARKNYYFYWLEWLLVLLLFMVYIFLFVGQRGRKEKGIYYKKRNHKAIF